MDGKIEHQEAADAGASKSTPIQAGAIKKNDIVLLMGHPCKVFEISNSKTDEQGHSKVSLRGSDVFTNKVYQEICSSIQNMEQIITKRKSYQCIDITDDGILHVLDDENETHQFSKTPLQESFPDVYWKIVSGFEEGKTITVIVISAMGEEAIIEAIV